MFVRFFIFISLACLSFGFKEPMLMNSDDDGRENPLYSEHTDQPDSHTDDPDQDGQKFQMVNVKETVIRNGDSVSVYREKCVDSICTTCVDNKCFNSTNFSDIKITGKCPLAACPENCTGFVMDKDNCPTCKCDGFATREPCSTNEECPSKQCVDSLCRYPAVSNDLSKFCTFASECPTTQNCNDSKCVDSDKEHLENKTCVFDFMCPGNYSCENMTCWKTGSDHLFGRQCIFNAMCPNGYRCSRLTCRHQDDMGGETFCIFDYDCTIDQMCVESKCKNSTRNGQVSDSFWNFGNK